MPLAKASSPKSTAICIAGESSDVLKTHFVIISAANGSDDVDGELLPEALTASAFQVSRLEQLALGIMPGLQNHQVQVHLHHDQDVGFHDFTHLVAPIPVFCS